MKQLFLIAFACSIFFYSCDNNSSNVDQQNEEEETTQNSDNTEDEPVTEEEEKTTVEIKAIEKDAIPFEYIFTPVGKGLIDAFEVKDATGTNYLLRGKNFLEGNTQMIVTYLKPTEDKPEILTTAMEDLVSCKFDIVEEHLKEVKISDLDEDGNAELMMLFKLDCTSDVSPNKLYLAMFEGKDRYLMKGVTEVDGMGGDFEADKAFQSNEVFLKAATDFWNQHKKESYN